MFEAPTNCFSGSMSSLSASHYLPPSFFSSHCNFPIFCVLFIRLTIRFYFCCCFSFFYFYDGDYTHTHTHTHTYIYIYIYIYVCSDFVVCFSVCLPKVFCFPKVLSHHLNRFEQRLIGTNSDSMFDPKFGEVTSFLLM